MTGNTEVLKSFHTYKKQGVDYKISEERKDMADNRKMQQAKAAKNADADEQSEDADDAEE